MTKEANGRLPELEDESGLLQTRKLEILSSMHERGVDPINQKHSKGNVHFKILVPSIAAGAIIGKGGEAITDIQNKTAAKVKMSKANDFYPGTTERVCLIIGTIESILQVFQYISEKIYEKPESLLRIIPKGGRMPMERHKQVKILVPNSTAGIIIGKRGSFIKEVKESTGVFIQVSQKSKELNLAERCVTVAGELSQTYEAVKQLLSKIADDPQSSSCPNISYAEISRPVANAYPSGSPYALVLGSSLGLSDNAISTTGTDSLMAASGQPNAGSCAGTYPSSQLGAFSPISPTGSGTTPGQLFGASPPSAFAAAVAAMGAANSFPPGSCNGPGRIPAMLSSHTTVRALTGRGGSIGHHHSPHSQAPHSSSQSLLGSVNAHLGTTGSSTHGSPVNSVSSTGSTIGLEVVRNILRSAGYSDVATEEIANAMHVLNLYGFISMSSLTGCAGGPVSISSTMNNGHFSVANNSFGNSSGSLSGYVSGGPHSPAFSSDISGHRGIRSSAIGPTSLQTYHHHQSLLHGQQYSSRPVHTTITHSAQHRLNSTCTSMSKDIKPDEPLLTTIPSIVCEASDVHVPDVDGNLYPKITPKDSTILQSPTHSPIVEARSRSPTLVSSISRSGAIVSTDLPIPSDFIQRLSETSLPSKLTTENGSRSSSSDSLTNGSRSGNLWNS